MNEEKKRVVEKIRKLFALAEDNPNQEEAENCLDRAHEFMKKHGVQMLDIAAGEKVGLDTEIWESPYKSQIDTYSRLLAQAMASLFDCEHFMYRPGKKMKYKVKMCFAGEVADVAVVVHAWPTLVKMAKKLARQCCGAGWDHSHRSFCEGFAARINERVKAMQAKDEMSAEVSDQQYGLVVVEKKIAIQEMFDKNKIKLKVTKRAMKGQRDGFAAHAGAMAGDRVNLNFRGGLKEGDQNPKLGN